MSNDLYRLYAADGRLLYVGISYSAIQRMAQHKADKAWFGDVARIDIEKVPGERAAVLAAERAAIATEKPIHNVKHNRGAGPEEIAMPANATDDQRLYFLTFDDEKLVERQGYVIQHPYGWIATYFSWWCGEETNSELLPAEGIYGWKLYRDYDTFIEAANAASRYANDERRAQAEERLAARVAA